ncbi:toxin-antitoxin system TumE family protein [Rhizobium panacihumi]|uniref:toxin-antitoxin system TumE family protein n=1 Tax=Rhizobium panacihumi TaxID=2008450 RepID=UPI003D7A9867
MADALLILDRKLLLDGGWIIQMKVWRLPVMTGEPPHVLKYSLFFGRPGERVIGYDNEAGKGDHRHYRDREEPYVFTGLEQMIRDFQADIRQEMNR